ncbi:hypothetical protein VHA01S_069_00270 [Vibrio halioticoli NBRC 102217]|uniref:Uncharacterized protein n=1 Tax=Vibrio halioticoli NBRC 102217 TaxID=1219072 RepID=V5F646_9VIBR|nr:hypothetical protein [Vibrio halioticoli]GAD91139.1 hypothetical protein VHA01S_069_00270 [Vibrio halioticoli NBRC 102217]
MQSRQSVLAKNIEKRMHDLNIPSNLALSKASGVSRVVITNILRHPEKSIMADSALLLSKHLKCRIEWLLTGEGPINHDDEINHQRRSGAPLLLLNDITEQNIEDLLLKVSQSDTIPRFMCPTGNKPSIFAIWQSQPIGRINHAGYLYFDHKKLPTSGQLVIAKTTPESAAEYMEFYATYDKKFLRYIERNIPEGLRMIELKETMQIIATFESFVIT